MLFLTIFVFFMIIYKIPSVLSFHIFKILRFRLLTIIKIYLQLIEFINLIIPYV